MQPTSGKRSGPASRSQRTLQKRGFEPVTGIPQSKPARKQFPRSSGKSLNPDTVTRTIHGEQPAMNLKRFKDAVSGHKLLSAALVLLFAGAGTAATLTVFTTSTGQVSVQQAVTFDNDAKTLTASYDSTQVTAGESVTEALNLVNHLEDEPVAVELSNEYSYDGGDYTDTEEGVTTLYYTDQSSTRELVNENGQSETVTVTYGSDVTSDAAFFELSRKAGTLDDGNVATATFLIDEDNDGSTDYQIQHFNSEWTMKDADGSNERTLPSYITAEAADLDSDGVTEYRVEIDRLELSETVNFAVKTQKDGSGELAALPERSSTDFSWTDSSNYPSVTLGHRDGYQLEVSGTTVIDSVTSFSAIVEGGDYTIKNQALPVTN